MQSKLAFISNNIFKYLIFFCISFVWINFYYTNFFACVLISIFISCLLSYLTSKLSYKKLDKTVASKKQENQIKNTITQLLFYTPSELINYFYLLFNNYKNVTKNKYGILINNTYVMPYFSKELTVQNFLDLYKKFKTTKKKKLLILTNNISTELDLFLNNFDNLNFEILTGNDVYFKIINKSNFKTNQIVNFKSQKKLKFNQLINIAFNRKNTKNYFLSGLFLMVSSLFYKHTLYYLIFATVLFSFSLFSYYNKPFNQTTNKPLIE